MTDGRAGLPHDWSHRHMIFPQPESEAQRRQLEADPRFSLQTMTRTMQQLAPEETGPAISQTVERDWNEALGTSAFALSGPAYPAKYSFNVANPTPDCTKDYVVYTLPVAAATRFNVIAFNNLYVNQSGAGTCKGTSPAVLFAYNASQIGGNLSMAPVLSIDGTRIAFIEKTAGGAQLHVLKWRSGDKSSSFPKPFNGAPLPDCRTNGAAAPCEYSISYSSSNSTLGSPFVDYAGDTAYVTDDGGNVSAISPVFTATPANPPAVLRGYPVKVSAFPLTAPVFDSVSGNVFVVDPTKVHYVRTKAGSSGTCLSGAPPCFGGNSIGINTGAAVGATLDAPIVDSTNQTVFVFGWGTSSYNGATIVQSNTMLGVYNLANISGAAGGSTPTTLHSGTFDNAYFNNPSSGKLYACGEHNSGHFGTLWAVGFTGTAMKTGTASFGPLNLTTASIAGGDSPCSSLTEVFNRTAGKDLLYTGVTSDCAFGASANGCLFSFDITSGFPGTALAHFPSRSGTSGIVIDNVTGSATSATNIYFVSPEPRTAGCTVYTGGTNTTGNCAVKLTQSGLR